MWVFLLSAKQRSIGGGGLSRQSTGHDNRGWHMATQQDAQLMMQVLQWSSMSGGIEASRNLMSPDFDAARASAMDKDVFALLLLGETIGTFTKQGLLDAGLVDDLWAPALVWTG